MSISAEPEVSAGAKAQRVTRQRTFQGILHFAVTFLRGFSNAESPWASAGENGVTQYGVNYKGLYGNLQTCLGVENKEYE